MKIGLGRFGEGRQNSEPKKGSTKDESAFMLCLRHLAEYFAVRVVLSVIQAVRIETCDVACRWLAFVVADLLKIRGRIVEENLRHAFPEKTDAERKQIARGMWHHLLLMVCEIGHLGRKIHLTNWRKYVSIPNKVEWIQAVGIFGPKVCVTGHFGNFEALGHVSNFFGIRTYTVVRTLDNPYLDRLVADFRQFMGQRLLPKNDSAGQADEVLQTGGLLALLGDQHAGKKGCIVDFLGRPASCHKALALFALLNRAPLMVVNCTRTDGAMRFVMKMDAIVDPVNNPEVYGSVEVMTQWYNDQLAARIRQEPEQYWWLHNRWRDLSNKRKKRPTATAIDVGQMNRPAA